MAREISNDDLQKSADSTVKYGTESTEKQNGEQVLTAFRHDAFGSAASDKTTFGAGLHQAFSWLEKNETLPNVTIDGAMKKTWGAEEKGENSQEKAELSKKFDSAMSSEDPKDLQNLLKGLKTDEEKQQLQAAVDKFNKEHKFMGDNHLKVGLDFDPKTGAPSLDIVSTQRLFAGISTTKIQITADSASATKDSTWAGLSPEHVDIKEAWPPSQATFMS